MKSTLIKKQGYLEILCEGKFNQEALLALFNESLEKADDNGVEMVLIDIQNIETAKNQPSVVERYCFGQKTADLQVKHMSPVFLTVVGKYPLIDPAKFGEMVASNRGANVKVFNNKAKAIFWIENHPHIWD